jgi:hypothetical protein
MNLLALVDILHLEHYAHDMHHDCKLSGWWNLHVSSGQYRITYRDVKTFFSSIES